MSKAYAVTVTRHNNLTGETEVRNRTVVYADDEIEAAKLGRQELGTDQFRVDEIPGGDIPTDAEMNALQRELREEVTDLGAAERAGGGAYG
jgi:hypothetical protein